MALAIVVPRANLSPEVDVIVDNVTIANSQVDMNKVLSQRKLASDAGCTVDSNVTERMATFDIISPGKTREIDNKAQSVKAVCDAASNRQDTWLGFIEPYEARLPDADD